MFLLQTQENTNKYQQIRNFLVYTIIVLKKKRVYNLNLITFLKRNSITSCILGDLLVPFCHAVVAIHCCIQFLHITLYFISRKIMILHKLILQSTDTININSNQSIPCLIFFLIASKNREGIYEINIF